MSISKQDNFINKESGELKNSKENNKEEVYNSFKEEIKNPSLINQFINTKTFEDHKEKVTTLIQLKSGKLASGSYDNTIRIWDINGKTKINSEKTINETGHILFLLEFEKNKILSGTSDNAINLWNLDSECEVSEYNFKGHLLWN